MRQIKITNLVVNNIQFVRNANAIPIKRALIGVRADIIKIMLKCNLIDIIYDQIMLVTKYNIYGNFLIQPAFR